MCTRCPGCVLFNQSRSRAEVCFHFCWQMSALSDLVVPAQTDQLRLLSTFHWQSCCSRPIWQDFCYENPQGSPSEWWLPSRGTWIKLPFLKLAVYLTFLQCFVSLFCFLVCLSSMPVELLLGSQHRYSEGSLRFPVTSLSLDWALLHSGLFDVNGNS